MIEIPVHNMTGKQVDTLKLDEQLLGGEVRHVLLKQAFVRYHANARLGTSKTKKRSEIEGSTRKLYKQKGTGNARRGALRTNIMRGGGRGHAKRPHSWRLDMPHKMRRLANRNAVLAKVLDNEIRIVDKLDLPKPSSKKFTQLLSALSIDRSCLLALTSTTGSQAQSAANVENVSIRRVDQLNVFDLLNHRFLLVEQAALKSWIEKSTEATARKGA